MIRTLNLLRGGGFALLALALFPAARAAVLAEFTSGGFPATNNFSVFGQSFTPVGAGSFTNIAFNFFSDVPATTPSAGGTAFLLSTVYAGTPAALTSGTPGFLGSATAASGFYNFDSGVTLNAGTQYFLYTNAAFPVSGSNTGGYSGGGVYISTNGAAFQLAIVGASGVDAYFRVTGDAAGTSVPDSGATVAMLGVALVGLATLRRHRA